MPVRVAPPPQRGTVVNPFAPPVGWSRHGTIDVPPRHARDAVARPVPLWQDGAMTTPPHNPRAGGLPIAAGTLFGAIIGALLGEATIGLLVGLALGIAIAVLIWRSDRR